MERHSERGIIVSTHSNASFTVLLRGDRFVCASLSGKLRTRSERFAEGDLVTVVRSSYPRTPWQVVRREGHVDTETGVFREVPR